jgi:hypothetical protein
MWKVRQRETPGSEPRNCDGSGRKGGEAAQDRNEVAGGVGGKLTC